MVARDAVLAQLIRLIDRVPATTPPARRPRGRPVVYSDRFFLKALVIMLVRNPHTVNELLGVLAHQPTPEMRALRAALLTGERGEFPSRRTWERRLKALPDALPARIGARIGLLGRHLVALIDKAVGGLRAGGGAR